MRFFLTVILFSFSSHLYSQDFDLRQVQWGMTAEKIQQIESPLIGKIERNISAIFGSNPNNYDSEKLTFENVVIDDMNITIIYYFKNKLLSGAEIKLIYDIKKPTYSDKNLSERFKSVLSIFGLLDEVKYNILGWQGISDCLGEKYLLKYSNKILNMVETCTAKKASTIFSFENNRTLIDISIPTRKNAHSFYRNIGIIYFKAKI